MEELKNELAFSRNAVCMDISGPEMADLAFVDLPGIIQNASSDTVQLVEDLVKSHIKGNCLILVTLPMNDDIENQKAMQLAKQIDPAGLRTIGVMTKPDTLPAGATKARDLWLDPDDDERAKGITNAQARDAEMAFFRHNAPWSTSSQKYRFGTAQLVASLSKVLTKVIYDTMPKLRKEATTQLNACIQRLKELLPAITAEPTSYVLSLLTTFCRDVASYINGDTDTASLVQQNRRTYATFKRNIRSSAPPFVPLPSALSSRSGLAMYSEADSDDDDSSDVVDLTETGPRQYITLQDVRKHIHKSLGKELPGNVPYGAKVSLIRNFKVFWEIDTRKCFQDVMRAFEETLSRLIQQHFERYHELKSRLHEATKVLLDTQKDVAWERVQDILDREETPFTQNKHYYQVSKAKYLSIYRSARAGKTDAAQEPAQKRRKVEGNVVKEAAVAIIPSTPQKAAFATSFKSASTVPQTPTPKPSFETQPSSVPQKRSIEEKRELDAEERARFEQQAITALTVLLGHNVTLEDFARLLPPDVYEEELEVMAEVRAYFKVAYKRMIDDVPMAVDDKFLAMFSGHLQEFLLSKLGIGGPNSSARCAAYLA
ncbi:uncharacterized protein PHACADRAFT_198273 [Phanerochaete carnosa HHB-10118-sp]|uniref:GED domain-containing protein n=1 Tax=Phanerochaete carnosa (strain HHB-10118-sp) TaxID=650164 RepID=K5VZD9_PHACS|nr:uncharacterized protein PHACADRAFT_198273 [Phanerochaete carnosa HHB-10118-sp]EKM52205.1 hypothetical protein PHACADRAFT_198273 [Phanerochaete carnosa HHB-10118-sp]